MRIESLIASLQHELKQNNVLLEGENRNLLGNVKLGDTLQGKVIRDLGNKQWLMRFGQTEVSVKSQIALLIGDVFRGRVREVGKQVVLERLPNVTASINSNSSTVLLPSLIGTTGYAGLLALIQGDISKNKITRKNKEGVFVRENAKTAAKAFLSHFGFSHARDIEMSLSSLFSYSQELVFSDLKLPELSFQFTEDSEKRSIDYTENQYFTEKFSEWLQVLNFSEKLVLDEQPQLAMILLYMLNIQNMDKWQHFFGQGNLILDGKYTPLSILVFDNQPRAGQHNSDTPFQCVTLGCDHPVIGGISLSMVFAQQNLQLVIAVSDEDFAQALRASSQTLKQALENMGIALEDFTVGVIEKNDENWAIKSVVDVSLRDGALDRLV